MGNRSRHKSRHQRANRLSLPLAQVMRTHCTECGSPVEWLTGDEALHRGIDLRPALELLDTPDVEVWACTACENFGVMGGSQFGTF